MEVPTIPKVVAIHFFACTIAKFPLMSIILPFQSVAKNFRGNLDFMFSDNNFRMAEKNSK